MADWEESEHPRDDIGRFRDKMNRDNWVNAIIGRLGGVAWPEARLWTEITSDYGERWDDDGLPVELDNGEQLVWYAMPEQEVAIVGFHVDGPRSGDGNDKPFVHVFDANPRSLRNTARLLFWMPDLDDPDEFEAEDGADPDGMVVRSSLPSGETVGLLPDGTVRWLIPGRYPPIDFTRSEAFEMARRLNDAADRTEHEIDNYQDSLEEEGGEVIAEFAL